MIELIAIRYVDGLQKKIQMLESQLNARNSVVEIVSNVRRISDHDRNHAAAALSALAAAPSPPVPNFTETSTTQLLYPCSETEGDLPIIAPDIPDGNETYEWDEGGDEKELGTDAMGAASTRDYKPGFFGKPCLLQYLRQVAHQRYHLWKASKQLK